MRENNTVVMAAYICAECQVEGIDRETAPNQVECWNCGRVARITARMAKQVTPDQVS